MTIEKENSEFLLHFRLCRQGCLDTNLVKGKIVLCNQSMAGVVAYTAGAAGAILLNEPTQDYSSIVPLPELLLNFFDHATVMSYILSNKYGIL